jgi:radical SAM protein with 4Fe4S-binding SPASM domain
LYIDGVSLARVTSRAEQRNIPLSALFELTGRCNLDCVHCYLDIAHPPDELSTEQALHVIDELHRAGTFFLTLTGGEIFLRKDILKIAWHARRKGMALRMFTNATRITREIAAEVARLKPLAVEVSIYGAHADVHDTVTKRQHTLRRTLRGVLRLRRAGVNVGLKAPLMSHVSGEVERLFALADRLGAPMKFDPFVTPRHDGADAPLAVRADGEALARALAHPRLGLVAENLPRPFEPDQVPCALARRTVKISPTGEVYPCPTYPTALGNILERPFAELWAGGELLDRLRALRVRDLEGDCHGCGQSGYCGRCTAVALMEHGHELGPSHESCRIADAKERALGLAPATPTGRVHLRVVNGKI